MPRIARVVVAGAAYRVTQRGNRRAHSYTWSSAAAHCGLRSDPLLSPLPPGPPATAANWSAWLADDDAPGEVDYLRLCTRTGRPAAGKDFTTKLEQLLLRPLRAKRVGRPGKEQHDEPK